MTIAEALSEGLQVTVVGLAIVFGVLIILMLVLMAFKALFFRRQRPSPKQNLPTTASL